ncbi:MAG: PH domain-containing protein [Patescibacteria group bacterium]
MQSNKLNYELDEKVGVEQIQGSIAILITKLVLTLVLFESIYSLTYYLLSIGFALPFDWHHHISVGLFVASLVKVFFQTYLVIWLVLSWSNNIYFLAGKHLIKRTGIFSSKEEISHFDNIRSISITQTFLGTLFNYGDITLKTSASGGYQGDVVLTQINNPKKYEEIIKKLF